jgi:arsenate reductase
MSEVTIWHNPRCTKSRETLALLEKKGVAPKVRLYLEKPPSRPEIETLIDLTGGDARALLRDGEPEFKATGKKAAALDRKAIVDLIVSTPKLLQRPVVVAGGKAAIGRPPEAVLAILPRR